MKALVARYAVFLVLLALLAVFVGTIVWHALQPTMEAS